MSTTSQWNTLKNTSQRPFPMSLKIVKERSEFWFLCGKKVTVRPNLILLSTNTRTKKSDSALPLKRCHFDEYMLENPWCEYEPFTHFHLASKHVNSLKAGIGQIVQCWFYEPSFYLSSSQLVAKPKPPRKSRRWRKPASLAVTFAWLNSAPGTSERWVRGWGGASSTLAICNSYCTQLFVKGNMNDIYSDCGCKSEE